MKVIHVVRSLDFGGAEKLVLALAGRQRESLAGEVEIACLMGGGSLREEAGSLGIPVTVTGLGRIRYLSGIRNLKKFFRAKAPDVVHTHNFLAHVHAAPAARSLRIPVVHTKHGRAVTSFGWSPQLRRYLYGLSDALVVVSEETGDIFSKRSGIKRGKLRVVHNGIDTARYRAVEPAGPGMPGMAAIGGGSVVFGCVSRLDPVKDHPTMVRAFSEVARREEGCFLLIVGEGPQRGVIEKMIAELGLEGRVIMPGFTPDVPRYMAAMSLFLQPSLDEGLSLTILEAAASGVPVVATPVGGTPEIIEEGVTGNLVEPGDWEGLARVMSDYIRDPGPFREMAARARKKIEEKFSIGSMESQYRSIYEEVSSRRGKD